MNMSVYIAKEDRPVADNFLKFYRPYAYQGALDANKKEATRLRKLTSHCRFCKKDREHTLFTQDTHLISKLLGKNAWYSHDECDTCNQQFKLYENDLACYLGTSRVFNHMLPGTTAPGFESANGNIKLRKKNDFILLEKKDNDNEDLKVDLNKGTASIKIDTQLFRPVHVYKALLKIAMGVLPAVDVADYEAGFDFLLKMENHPELDYFKESLVTETEMTIARPYAQLVKKIAGIKADHLPQHLFCLTVGHLMFQLPLPGHRGMATAADDMRRIPAAPYIQLNAAEPHDGIIRHRTVADLRSIEQTTRDDSIHFGFSTENLTAIKLDFDITELFRKRE